MARFVLCLGLFCGALNTQAGEFLFSKTDVQVVDLSAKETQLLSSLDQSALQQVLTINLLNADNEIIGEVWGQVRADTHSVHFTPRFPFDEGQIYQVVLQLQGEKFSERYSRTFQFDANKVNPNAQVTAVFPSADVLPENLFKFYIHFSEPMRRGQAYEHIRLLDSKNRAVELPFLELTQELWDPNGQRFTLLFDPGRTKKGIKPNRDMGLPLKRGETFTLVIDHNWQTVTGAPLLQSHKKTFTVGEQDIVQPDINRWAITLPAINSRQALSITLDEPLDRAQLENAVWIETDKQQSAEGVIEIENELVWRFTPSQPWRSGNYRVVAKSYLEDRAANSLGRAFEVIRTENDPDIPDLFFLPFTLK